jgi:hypothetical protein
MALWRKLAFAVVAIEVALICLVGVFAFSAFSESAVTLGAAVPVFAICLVLPILIPAYLAGRGYAKARWIIVGILFLQAILPAVWEVLTAHLDEPGIPWSLYISAGIWVSFWLILADTVEKGFRPRSAECDE